MKVVLVGTNHSREEQGVDVGVIYENEDTWTFEFGGEHITISDLSDAMQFLREQASNQ